MRIVLDFDGVLYSYVSGWTGIDVLPDPPVVGAQDFCKFLLDKKFEVYILSTRFGTEQQGKMIRDPYRAMKAVERWLDIWDFPKGLKLASTKPAANLYVDDRGIRFDGSFGDLKDYIENINPTLDSWVKQIQNEQIK